MPVMLLEGDPALPPAEDQLGFLFSWASDLSFLFWLPDSLQRPPQGSVVVRALWLPGLSWSFGRRPRENRRSLLGRQHRGYTDRSGSAQQGRSRVSALAAPQHGALTSGTRRRGAFPKAVEPSGQYYIMWQRVPQAEGDLSPASVDDVRALPSPPLIRRLAGRCDAPPSHAPCVKGRVPSRAP